MNERKGLTSLLLKGKCKDIERKCNEFTSDTGCLWVCYQGCAYIWEEETPVMERMKDEKKNDIIKERRKTTLNVISSFKESKMYPLADI